MWSDPFGSESEREDVEYPFTGLSSVVERIREYVHDDYSRYTPDVLREVAQVEAYIDKGIADFEHYLARHAEFTDFLGGEE